MTDTTKQKKKPQLSIIDNLIQLDIDAENIFVQVLDRIQKYVKFDAATIFIVNSETEKLEKAKSFKQDVEILTGLQVEFGDGLSGWSAESAQTILIPDRTKKKSFNPDSDYASFLSVPILRNNIIYGVINFGCYTKDTFSNEHIEIIESASPIISYVINYYQLSQKNDKIKSAYINAVDQYNVIKTQLISDSTANTIASETAEVIHGINNSLSIILGNLQCILIGKNEFNQKSLSRLRRIESAAKKIAESNTKILNLNYLVSSKNEEIAKL